MPPPPGTPGMSDPSSILLGQWLRELKPQPPQAALNALLTPSLRSRPHFQSLTYRFPPAASHMIYMRQFRSEQCRPGSRS